MQQVLFSLGLLPNPLQRKTFKNLKPAELGNQCFETAFKMIHLQGMDCRAGFLAASHSSALKGLPDEQYVKAVCNYAFVFGVQTVASFLELSFPKLQDGVFQCSGPSSSSSRQAAAQTCVPRKETLKLPHPVGLSCLTGCAVCKPLESIDCLPESIQVPVVLEYPRG